MKLYLMTHEPGWWIWLATATSLAIGVAGFEPAFQTALALSAAQAAWHLGRQRSWSPYAVQIRVAYTIYLLLYFVPNLRWLLWSPVIGTFAMLTVGYCPMARILSLMPWNDPDPLTWDLLRRTFFSSPVIGRPDHGLPALAGCPGGICELETHAAYPRSSRGKEAQTPSTKPAHEPLQRLAFKVPRSTDRIPDSPCSEAATRSIQNA